MRGWVLSVVLALAHGKDCPISIPHANEYSYICDTEEVSFQILNDDATSRTPCATALLPAATTNTPQFATATCPDQTIDGVTRQGVIKCLMYAGVGSAAQCPTTDCDTDNFPDEQACDTCNRIGKGCDECEYLPRELGQACVGLNSCSVGATTTGFVSAGGAQIAFKSEKREGRTVRLLALCKGYLAVSAKEAQEEAEVTDEWSEFYAPEWKNLQKWKELKVM